MNFQPIQPRLPLLRIIVGNGFLMSVVYLLLGLTVELLRAYHPVSWLHLDRLSFTLDSLAAASLDLTGWLPRLREGLAYGTVSAAETRLVFAGTTVGLIFILAFGVGALLAGLRWMSERRR